jgi:hypothetical protein
MGSRHLIAFRARSAVTVHALAAATGRLAEALRELELAHEVAGAGGAVDAALELAVRQRLAEVIAHREALGIGEHAVLYEVLRVPADLRAPPARAASGVA